MLTVFSYNGLTENARRENGRHVISSLLRSVLTECPTVFKIFVRLTNR